jgi:hypothetical protein
MTNERAELLPVTQADRDAAAANVYNRFILQHGSEQSWMHAPTVAIRRGDHDHHYEVQAFARHRLAALTDAPWDREGKLERARQEARLGHHSDAAEMRAALLPTTPAPTSDGALREALSDTLLLDALREQSWDLRCFDRPTGGDDADIGWRVVGHWQAEPHERTVAEVYVDDPRAALRAALSSSAPVLEQGDQGLGASPLGSGSSADGAEAGSRLRPSGDNPSRKEA